MLHITVLSVGKKHDTMHQDAIATYERKLRPHCQLNWQLIPSSDIQTESEQLMARAKDSFVVLLDEQGQSFSSQDIAVFLEKRQNQADNKVAIIIGGAYGVSEMVKIQADTVISLSTITLPHQLVRVVLLEQLYRGFSILKNTGYHHG